MTVETWKQVRLGEAFAITSKPRTQRVEDYERIPFVPMNFVPEDGLYFDRYLLKRPDELTSGTYFEPGDALIPKITPSFENGKQGIIPSLPTPFGYATTEVVPFRGIDGLSDTRFLFFYLLRPSVRAELAAKMEGTTGRQRLSKSTMVNLDMPLPPLPVQQAIAEVLRAVQEAKDARRRELTLERERKAALMNHVFTQGTREEDRVNTELGQLPKSWVIEPVGNIVPVMQYGVSVPGQDAGRAQLLRMNNIIDGRIHPDGKQFVSLSDKEHQAFRVNRGDVLFNRTNSFDLVGKTGLFDRDEECICASYLIRLVPDASRLLPGYLSAHFCWSDTQARLKGLASRGVSQSNISAGKLKGFRIALPSVVEQEAAVSLLDACDGKISAVAAELSAIQELFSTLLEELMSGRLPIEPSSDRSGVTA